jgi:hypothetical protein
MKTKEYTKNEVEDKIHEICIDQIEEEYRVFWQSDDSGLHISVYYEVDIPKLAEQLLTNDFMGRRLILVITPKGFLNAFHPLG